MYNLIMLTVSQIRDVVSRIGQKYGVKRIYLFGSYAKNTASEDSDIDLIIDRGEVRTYKEYFHLCEELSKELGTDVDVTAEEGMLPGFFELIKNDRILLYAA
ncbi:nucleotidyltransferase domain-containing protein [Candidatus Saccharibacteria bacterium]|nr:nucleotidyltransferase domain-containing protein [Candidatus Saccharibacteria bacterium]